MTNVIQKICDKCNLV